MSVVSRVAAVALLLVSATRTPASAQTTPCPLVQTRIDLQVDIDYAAPRLAGTATLTVLNPSDTPAHEVPLLLNRLMRVGPARGSGGAALAIASDVVVFEDDPFRQVRTARIHLPHPLARGQTTSVTVDFSGPLVGYTEAGMLYVRDRIDPAFTILRTDAFAFPTLGVASQRANRAAPRRDFAFEAHVTAPDDLTVATGGQLVGRAPARAPGRATSTFRGAGVPFLNIAIAPYTRSDSPGLAIYALPDDASGAAQVHAAAAGAFRLLERWYGARPTDTAVTIIEIPAGFGSQASVTGGIILDAAAFRDRGQLPQLYHELSHLWNAPDDDPPSSRWNEGLAVYLQYRLARELDGYAATAAALQRTRDRACGDGRLKSVAFAGYGAHELTDASYRVGFLMFTVLERLVGVEALDAGLRAYLSAHATGGGSVSALAGALDDASPMELKPFFDDWLFTTAWFGTVCGASDLDTAAAHWARPPSHD